MVAPWIGSGKQRSGQRNLCFGTSIAQAANARGAGRLCNEQAILKSDTLTTSTTKKNKY